MEYKPYQVFMYGMKTCHEYENSYPLSALVPKSKLACYHALSTGCYSWLQIQQDQMSSGWDRSLLWLDDYSLTLILSRDAMASRNK